MQIYDEDYHVYRNQNLRNGDKVKVKKSPIYATATEKKKFSNITGEFVMNSNGIIHGRIRIANPETAETVGWINADECKPI